MHSELLCSSDEFWMRVSSFVVESDLVCFQLHQRTRETKIFSKEQLNSESYLRIWQCDLWIAEEIPTENAILPAQAGWVLLDPPAVEQAQKMIGISYIGAQDSWLHPSTKTLMRNDRISVLFKALRRRLFQKTRFEKVTEVREPKSPDTHRKMRFTEGALKLQEEQWIFVDDPKKTHPLKLILPI